MQSTFHNDDMKLTLEYNSAWLHLPDCCKQQSPQAADAEPLLVIAVTKIVWRDVERSVSLAVETNVFDANLGIETIAKEIFSSLRYNLG